MQSILYNKPFDDTVPSAERGALADGLYQAWLCVQEDAKNDPDIDLSSKMPLKDLVVYAIGRASEVIDDRNIYDMQYDTHLSWPVSPTSTVKQSSSTAVFAAFMSSEKALPSVRISPLRLLQMAHNISVIEGNGETISDQHVIAAASAFYASFDERAQAIFYPSTYCFDLASDGSSIFELSSAISLCHKKVKIVNITPTALWMSLMVQEPVPSLVYDFMEKDRGTIRSEGFTEEDEIVIESISEMCHVYTDMLLPAPVDMSQVTFSDSMLDLVADCIIDSPANMRSVVHAMLVSSGDAESAERWGKYCDEVELSCDLSGTSVEYSPDFVVLDTHAQLDMLNLVKKDAVAPIRRILASASLLAFLDESLDGGAPDTVCLKGSPTKTDESTYIVSGAKLIGYDTSEALDWHCEDSRLGETDEKILLSSRRLAHFGVPLLFQRAILARMIERGGVTVSVADIAAALAPTNGSVRILAENISPYAVHAGVDIDAARLLSVTSALLRRLSLTMILDEESAMRLYSSFLGTAVSTYGLVGEDCCEDTDQWMLSMSSIPFDPRMYVPYSPDGAQSVINAPSVSVSSMPSFSSRAGYDDPMSSGGQSGKTAIEAFCTDLVAQARKTGLGADVVGRDETISLVETILSRRDKSNPLLLAPAGAGKSAIAEALAYRLATNASPTLSGYGLVSLDLTSLLADTNSVSVMTDRVEKIVEEAISTNTIVFIDEIHMIGAVGSGELNVGNVLKPYLARGGLRLIGATTEREYNYTIAKDKALARRFSPMHLPPLEFSALMSILEEKSKSYGSYHNVSYAPGSLRSAALMAEDYMSGKESPDREIDVIDTAASVAVRAGSDTVSDAHIAEAVRLLTSNRSVKTTQEIASELVIGDFGREELSEIFPEIAGQWRAKESVARRIAEAKLDISAREKPRNIFMFVGESGVGKTYMAHQMAALLDVSPSDVLSLNLGEFQDRASHTRLLGASPQYVGYQEGGVLTNFLLAHPHGIVVLDEFEKSDPAIQQVFLGVFDTGKLSAANGDIVNCRSATFVCTSNVGHGAAKRHALGFAPDDKIGEIETEQVMEALEEIFGSALMNRIDEIVVFDDLNDDDLVEICVMSYRRLAEKLKLRHGVSISDAYSEDQMREDARTRISEMKEKDARTVWGSMEKDVIRRAIPLLR